jgi:aspartyl-tRNA(Asn)/glutamyl-tRNA(Gln) amidotransferase subunit A
MLVTVSVNHEKAAVYARLLTQLRALIAEQTDFLANISNFAALVFTTLPDLNWAGFYLLRGTDLVLGPFQGKPACSCIALGDGVCGTAALKRAAVLVPDVHAFPGHIVCDEASQSEIVVPVFKDGSLIGVLDMDSPMPSRFDDGRNGSADLPPAATAIGVRAPTLVTLAAALARAECSSRALVEECLARIEDIAGEGPRTFLHVDRDAALAQADAIDALRACGAAPSACAGIPISIKDLFDVTGQITRAGSVALMHQPPASVDASSIARLRQAGLVLIGRTNMTEFAFSGLGLNPHFGTPLNPWNRAGRHIPGGSSSGAAVSVADGMAHAALGTDTGGSCRIPAAFTGLVGFKPTARRVPRDGMIPLSSSLDSIGPIARSVSCCAWLDALLAGEPVPNAQEIAAARLRFAIPRTMVLDDLDRHVAAAFTGAIARLINAGAHIEEIDVPEFAELPLINAKGSLASAESYAWHRVLLPAHARTYDPRVLSRIEAGAAQSAADYIALLEARTRFIVRVNQRLTGFDAWLMPTVPVIAPRLSDLEPDTAYYRTNALVLRNSSIVNFLDGCAISIPIHAPGDPPVGLTLLNRHGQDRHLLACAAVTEQQLRTDIM